MVSRSGRSSTRSGCSAPRSQVTVLSITRTRSQRGRSTSGLEFDDKDLVICGVQVLDCMLGRGLPDDIASAPRDRLSTAACRSRYASVLEVDDEPVVSLRGRYRPWPGAGNPADQDPVVVQDYVDVRRVDVRRSHAATSLLNWLSVSRHLAPGELVRSMMKIRDFTAPGTG